MIDNFCTWFLILLAVVVAFAVMVAVIMVIAVIATLTAILWPQLLMRTAI